MQGQQENKSKIFDTRSRFLNKEMRAYVIGDSCCNKTLLLAEDLVSEVFHPIKFNKPENCDVLIVHGIINPKLVPYIKETIGKMSPPFVTIALGQCTLSGTFFKTIPLQEITHVDINIPGCAPDPTQIKQAMEQAKTLLKEKNLNEDKVLHGSK